MNNKIYCYIRVSTDKQDHERQENILKEKGYIDGVNCEYIKETYTGTTTRRPVFLDLINNKLKPGDTIICSELSRISRSVKGFNDLIDEIVEKKKVNIIIIKENFNLKANGNMDAMTKLIMHITSAFAEFERDIISDRTKESLRAKKINGTSTGRPIGHPRTEKSSQDNFIKTLEYMVNNNVGQKLGTRKTGFPIFTFRRDLEKYYDKYNVDNYENLLNAIRKDVQE